MAGPQKKKARKNRQESARTETRKKWLLGGGIGVGVLLLALLGMWAGGMFDGKVQVKTTDGILVIEVNEPNPDVLVDNETVTVSWHNGGKKAEIRVKPGTHKVVVKKDGFGVDGKELTFTDGDKVIFTARLLPDKREANADAPLLGKPPPPPDPKKPDAPRIANAADDDKGFISLFNGKDLTGWSIDGGPPGQWSVEGNTIVAQAKEPRMGHHLLTEKDYAGFVLRFDFKFEEESNGGVLLRAIKGEKLPQRNGALRFDHPKIKLTHPALKETQPTGTTHCLKSAAVDASPVEVFTLPIGTWHSMEVVVQGNRCMATVGGKKLVDATLEPSAQTNSNIVPGLGRRKGKVGFQIQSGVLRFRKIEIKELPAEPAPRRAADSLPPEAKEATQAYEKECAGARAKLLADFDAALDRLAKIEGPTGQRLKLIEAVKAEKKRFENKGLIPWSEPIRLSLAKYFVSPNEAEVHRGLSQRRLIRVLVWARSERIWVSHDTQRNAGSSRSAARRG